MIWTNDPEYDAPTETRKADGSGCDVMPCSRLPDPEGKHLEICRLQLADVVEQLDAAKDWVAWSAREWEHRRHADWPSTLLTAARALKIIPENAEPIHGAKDSD